MDPRDKEPFADLSVCYMRSEAYLYNLDGEQYPDPPSREKGTTYTGADAYEFLACLNREDKRYAKIQQEQGGGYEKTWLSVSYGDFDSDEMRVDLGDLRLGNKTSVAEALDACLSSTRQYTLDHPDRLEQILRFNQEAGYVPESQTPAGFAERLRGDLEHIHDLMRRFGEEEQAFLREHPEFRAVNEEQVTPFYYVCRRSELPQIQKDMQVLDTCPSEAFHDSLLIATDYKYGSLLNEYMDNPEKTLKDNPRNIRACESIPDSLVVFGSQEHPNLLASDRHEDRRYMLLIPQEDLRKMKPLRDLSYDDVYQELPGLYGLRDFVHDVQNDLSEASEAIRRKCYVPEENLKAATLLYKGEPFFSKKYLPGSGELVLAAPDYLPKTGKPETDEALSVAYDTCSRYLPDAFPSRNYEDWRLNQLRAEGLPGRETSLENLKWVCDKPDPEEYRSYPSWIDDAKDYYLTIGRIMAEKPGKMAAREASTKALVEDGYDMRKIKTIVRQSYDAAWSEVAPEVLARPEIKKRIKALRKKDTGR